jgi:hypothetical protein
MQAILPVGQPQSNGSNALVYDRWFTYADSDRDGRVTGKVCTFSHWLAHHTQLMWSKQNLTTSHAVPWQDAVGFFEKSGLSREVLAKVGVSRQASCILTLSRASCM